MKKTSIKILISLVAFSLLSTPVYSESLFKSTISDNIYYAQPRSLYSSIRAKSIGDLVTIVLQETINTADNLKYDTSKTSNTVDGFSRLINKLLPGNAIQNSFGGYGGTNTVSNTAQAQRKTTFSNTIAAQVVQIMPNGNLLVQGKKTTVNGGERMNIIISGIVDPRLLDNTGSIYSKNVANLQVAYQGEGNISRSNSDGPINKFIKYLF